MGQNFSEIYREFDYKMDNVSNKFLSNYKIVFNNCIQVRQNFR